VKPFLCRYDGLTSLDSTVSASGWTSIGENPFRRVTDLLANSGECVGSSAMCSTSSLPGPRHDRQHLAPGIRVDADRDQHRLACDHTGPRALARSTRRGSLRERVLSTDRWQIARGLHSLIDRADRGSRKTDLCDRLHLPRRHPCPVRIIYCRCADFGCQLIATPC
jgi:hypothetical protein